MLENTRQPATGQLLTPIVVPDKTTVPIAFNTQVFQNDMNDGFDHKRLIKMVPKKFQQNAKNLIEAFDDRANELTWDSSGVVYIDQRSVPGTIL